MHLLWIVYSRSIFGKASRGGLEIVIFLGRSHEVACDRVIRYLVGHFTMMGCVVSSSTVTKCLHGLIISCGYRLLCNCVLEGEE